jgi:hypothetical protein
MRSTAGSVVLTAAAKPPLSPLRCIGIFVIALLLPFSLQPLIMWAFPVDSPWGPAQVEGTHLTLKWNDRTAREVPLAEVNQFLESAEGRTLVALRRARVQLFYGVGYLLVAVFVARLVRPARWPALLAIACLSVGAVLWAGASYRMRSAERYRELVSASEFWTLQDQSQRARAGVSAAWVTLAVGVLCGVGAFNARRGGFLGGSTDAAQFVGGMRLKTDEELSRIVATAGEYTAAAQEAARRVLEDRDRTDVENG